MRYAVFNFRPEKGLAPAKIFIQESNLIRVPWVPASGQIVERNQVLPAAALKSPGALRIKEKVSLPGGYAIAMGFEQEIGAGAFYKEGKIGRRQLKIATSVNSAYLKGKAAYQEFGVPQINSD